MKTLVTYQSKTGFTKKYAEWIAADLACDLKEASGVNASDISGYDLIIHGGWIMGGVIRGLNKVRALQPKKLIVFGVGFTTKEDLNSNNIITGNRLEGTPFFYYQGGTNPDKMGFFSKAIMKMVTKKAVEYTDHTNKDEINELIQLVKAM